MSRPDDHDWQRSVMKGGAVWVICRRCGLRQRTEPIPDDSPEMPGPGYDAQTRRRRDEEDEPEREPFEDVTFDG